MVLVCDGACLSSAQGHNLKLPVKPWKLRSSSSQTAEEPKLKRLLCWVYVLPTQPHSLSSSDLTSCPSDRLAPITVDGQTERGSATVQQEKDWECVCVCLCGGRTEGEGGKWGKTEYWIGGEEV